MATQVQWRGGSTAEHATFTGAAREVTVDTQKQTLVIHDGSTAGGHPLQKQYPALGSAAAPAYTFTGDTNTGIYSPGADQLALSTNGTRRLLVDENGKVGIGAIPIRDLTVYGGSASLVYLQLAHSSASGTNRGLELVLNSTEANIINRETGGLNLNTAGGSTRFVNGGSERLRITADGKVGVGTSNPAYSLVVSASGASGIEFGPAFSGTANLIQHYNRSGAAYVEAVTDAALHRFNTSGTERLRITADGKLGVGTSVPTVSQAGAGLHLRGANAGIRLNATAGGWAYEEFADGTDTVKYISGLRESSNTYNICPGTSLSSNSGIHLDSSGNVGVGTSGPTNSLEVEGVATSNLFAVKASSGGDCLAVTARAAGNGATISALNSAQGDYEPLEMNGEFIYFQTRTGVGTVAERARIDASGRLLVGTSSARNVGSSLTQLSYLQIESSSSTLGGGINITANRNDTLGASINLAKSRASAVGGVSILAANDQVGIIRFAGADGTDLETPAASIEAYVDGTPGANDMPGRLVFSTTADGASSPTERMRIDSSGALGVFCATTTDALYLSSAGGAGTTRFLIRGRYSATGVYGGTDSFFVYTNGNVQNTNNSYTGISDIKLKENIVDANSQWDDIKALQVRNYNFKEGQTHTQIGLVAQEVELVSPGLVTESPDRDEDGNDLGTVTKSVNYSVLYMKAVRALQEAMERIETLEAKVAALESN